MNHESFSATLIWSCHLTIIRNFMVVLRLPNLYMGIPVIVRRHLYTESAPWSGVHNGKYLGPGLFLYKYLPMNRNSHLKDKTVMRPSHLLLKNKDVFILHSQYHAYSWHDGTRIQDISSHGIDLVCLEYSRPWFSIKMSSYQYRKSHCGDKTLLRPSYLHNRISYTGKMISLYWIRTLVSAPQGLLCYAAEIHISSYTNQFWPPCLVLKWTPRNINGNII